MDFWHTLRSAEGFAYRFRIERSWRIEYTAGQLGETPYFVCFLQTTIRN